MFCSQLLPIQQPLPESSCHASTPAVHAKPAQSSGVVPLADASVKSEHRTLLSELGNGAQGAAGGVGRSRANRQSLLNGVRVRDGGGAPVARTTIAARTATRGDMATLRELQHAKCLMIHSTVRV